MNAYRVCMLLLGCAAASAPSYAQELHVPVFVAPGTPQVPPGASNVSVGLRLPLPGIETVEVLRLGRSAADRPWQLAEIARRPANDRSHFAIQAPAGLETLLILRIPDVNGYILDGPFRWPHRPSAYTVAPRWRRTVRGGWTRNGAASPVWISSDLRSTAPEPWPRCTWSTDRLWECIGVPTEASGVILSSSGTDVAYALARAGRSTMGIEETTPASAPWGRLLIATVSGSPGASPPAATMSARRIEMPRARPQSIRVLASADASVRVEALTTSAYWVTGGSAHPDSWMEVTAAGRAPARITIRELAGAPAEFPLRVDLEPAVSLLGRVKAGPAQSAPNAIVSLFRLVPDPALPEKQPPRRVLVAEVTADDEGAFAFTELAMEKYELLAMHPSLGRAEQIVEPGGQELEIVLARPVRAIGRVLRAGAPAEGVGVRAMPDLAEFAAASDITLFAGGETRTDSDGRFVVTLAARGGGELRISAEESVRRVPLPPMDPGLRIVNVGDVDIGEPPAITLVFEASAACDLMLAGPQGRPGLTVVRATRIGPAMFEARVPESGRWIVSASCAGRERAVTPGIVEVQNSAPASTFTLRWPR